MSFKVSADVTREFFSCSRFLKSLLKNYTADFGLKFCWQTFELFCKNISTGGIVAASSRLMV
jgi:hypothetical protein